MTDTWHPDDNQCALFIEGTLDDATTQQITRHVARCNDCLEIIGGAVRSLREREWWQQPALWSIAAAVVLAIIGLAIFRQWRDANANVIATMAAAAPHDYRTLEPRLTGFQYAEYHRYRGDSSEKPYENDPAYLRFQSKAGDVLGNVQRSSSANGRHAAGIACIILDSNQQAVADLTQAANKSPNDPHIWSDLGAAQIQAHQYGDALASLDRALKLNAIMPEALYNRAVALEQQGKLPEAAAAWRDYLAVDSTSGWAGDARRNLGEQ